MPNTFQCPRGSHHNPKAGLTRLPLQENIDGGADRVVLVMVDDDEDDCLMVQEALQEACVSCMFRCVWDGAEMMDYLNRSGPYQDPKAFPRPDLILLDLNLPRMSGREVLKRLKTDPRFRAIPVVILTTSREIEDVKDCYDLGANSYITKQSSYTGFSSAIRTIAEYWIELATLPPRKAHHPGPSGRNEPS